MHEWWNNPTVAWGFLVIEVGGGTAINLLVPSRLAIPLSIVLVAVGAYLLVRAYRHRADIKQLIKELLSVGIYSDVPVNITRILYHDREKLAAGLSDGATSVQDKLVLSQLNSRKIVQLEQRKVRVYGSDNVRDEGYWILTELGKDVILYLQKN